MGVATKRHTSSLVDKPDQTGLALAQIVSSIDGKDVILGQCWVAATNRLVTCGHVVDRFVQDPSQISVYFPSSGQRYNVQKIQLHPSYVRQPDGLVKFDAAVLSVNLAPPDSLVLPLPFSYENALSTKQHLWTIRYPAHLGQLSAALEPLAQDGHFLGLLRKHDNFHLLHDIALAPGDSGAPIVVGNLVVAMHCGDTATVPGLNLPMTSIRLALWVDAFRDLGLPETKRVSVAQASRIFMAVFTLVLSTAIGWGAVYFFAPGKSVSKPITLSEPVLMPVELKFNEPLDHYHVGEDIEIHLKPKSPCYAFLLLVNEEGNVVEIYPGFGAVEPIDHSIRVDRGNKGGADEKQQLLLATDKHLKLYVIAVNAEDDDCARWVKTKFLSDQTDWLEKEVGALKPKESEIIQRLKDFQKQKPDKVFWRVLDVPRPVS